MNKEEILATVEEFPTETGVKAWNFQVEEKFYQVVSYGGYRVGDQSAIWEVNKRGKRLSPSHIFQIRGRDHMRCINEFLNTFETEE